MKPRLVHAVLGIVLGSFASGCGAGAVERAPSAGPTDEHASAKLKAATEGAEKSTAERQPSAGDTSASDQPEATGGSEAADSDTARSEARQPEEAPALPKKSRIDLMTGRETAYLIDYQHSGALETAKSNCSPKQAEAPTEETEEQAAERAEQREQQFQQCLKKAREKFSADVLRFRRDGLGNVQLVVYRRTGHALTELSVSNVELNESSPTTVKVEVKSVVAGQRPILTGKRQFEIKMPNSYSIELDDPEYGKLLYDEKVGLVAN